MQMLQYLIVCPLLFLAGFIDAIGGGGGLISIPAYIISGVPVHNAIATNKLSSCMGTGLTTWQDVYKRQFISRNIWREETLGFHIAVYGILHRSCGAEADGCFFRCGAGQADGLTAFIGAGGDQRQTCQDACLKGRLSCDFSQHLSLIHI